MKHNQQADAVWAQICQAAGLDPQLRLAARRAVLDSAQALECTVYRPDDNDPDAEEEDLGDARVLFDGPFQAPAEWDAATRAGFFGDDDPALFLCARIECEAPPAARGYFTVEEGDYVAVLADGAVQMYYLHDCREDADGCHCVLIRDDEPLF